MLDWLKTTSGSYNLYLLASILGWLIAGVGIFANFHHSKVKTAEAEAKSKAANENEENLRRQLAVAIEVTGVSDLVKDKLNPPSAAEWRPKPYMEPIGEGLLLQTGYIVGATSSSGKISAQAIETELINVSNSAISQLNGSWHVGSDNRQIPLQVSHNSLVDPEQIESIPPMGRVVLCCPLTSDSGLTGISLDELVTSWSPLKLNLLIDGNLHTYIWDAEKVVRARLLTEAVHNGATQSSDAAAKAQRTDQWGTVWR